MGKLSKFELGRGLMPPQYFYQNFQQLSASLVLNLTFCVRNIIFYFYKSKAWWNLEIWDFYGEKKMIFIALPLLSKSSEIWMPVMHFDVSLTWYVLLFVKMLVSSIIQTPLPYLLFNAILSSLGNLSHETYIVFGFW